MQRYFDIEKNSFLTKHAFLISLAGGIIIFILDLFTPRGIAEWLLYMLVMIFYWKYSDLKYVYYLASVYSIFVFLGYIFSPPGVPSFYSIINRVVVVLAMFLLSHFIFRERTIKKN